MTIDQVERFLLWSLALNYGVLLLWMLGFVFAHDWIRNLHGRWFRLEPDTFDAIHYGAMAAYKVAILMLNLVPYLALRLL